MDQHTKDDLIDKHRDINVDDEWAQYSCEHFCNVLAAVGIEILVPQIGYTVSYSQGDGANFAMRTHRLGSLVREAQKWMTAARDDFTGESGAMDGVALAVDEYADAMLDHFEAHLLSGELMEQLDETLTDVRVEDGRYQHSSTMSLGVFLPDGNEDENDTLKWLLDKLRAIADAMFQELQAEYEFQTSDEQVWESIVANGLDESDDDSTDETTKENELCCA